MGVKDRGQHGQQTKRKITMPARSNPVQDSRWRMCYLHNSEPWPLRRVKPSNNYSTVRYPHNNKEVGSRRKETRKGYCTHLVRLNIGGKLSCDLLRISFDPLPQGLERPLIVAVIQHLFLLAF